MIMDTMHRQLQENRKPYISVIIPVFNEEQTIKRCLQALINQNIQSENYEVVVVDNGSNDRSTQIIQKFPVKLFSENRAHNSYMARNCGLRHAKGEIIAFIDADCIAEKKWLKNLVEPFQDGRVGIVAGEVLSDKPNNLIQGFYEHSGILKQKEKVQKNIAAIATANVAIRKRIFDTVGNFDENFQWGGDNDFGIRIQKETNYLIQFDENARVYHSHRASLRGLFKHAYTYGLGKGRFSIKYSSNKRLEDIVEAFFTLLRLIAGIPVIPFHTCRKLTSGKTVSESLVYPILDKLFCIVDQVGKILFLIKLEDVFFRNS